MTAPRPSHTMAARRGLSWAIFCGASTLAMAAGIVVAALATGSRTSVAMVLLVGLIVIGIAAALMESIVSPPQNPDANAKVSPGGWSAAGSGGDGGGCG